MSNPSDDAEGYLHSATLGELFQQSHERGRAGLPIVSLTVDRGLIPRDEVERRVETNLTPEGHRLIRKGELAYNMMRMWQGVCYMASYDCLTSPAYVVLRPNSGVDPKFVEYFLRYEQTVGEFRRRSFGVVDDRLRLYFRDFCSIRANVPSSKLIQQKIARILTTVDNLIEKTESLIAKYQAIKQGMMHDLFTCGVDAHGRLRPPQTEAPDLYKQSELGWIPKEWTVRRLGEIVQKIADRDHFTPEYVEHGVPMVSPKDFVRFDRISFAKCQFITIEAHKRNRRKTDITSGDIVFTRIGAALGKACLVTPEMPEFSLLHSAVMIRADADRILPKYLVHVLKSFYFQSQIFSEIQSIGVPDLGLDKISAFQISVPSLAEQAQCATNLESIDATILTEYQSLNGLKQQRTGLLQDLLKGKVWVRVDESEEFAP